MREAVAALIGAIVGWFLSIWSQPLQNLLLGPRLTIECDGKSDVDTTMTKAGTPSGDHPSFWLRVRVANRGRETAREVEVFAIRLERHNPETGRFEPFPDFTPLNLKWSYINNPTVERIPRQIERLCDIFNIVWPYGGQVLKATDGVRAQLQLVALTQAQPGILMPGKYQLVLMVTAANARTIEKQLCFRVPNQWFADRLRMAESLEVVVRSSFV